MLELQLSFPRCDAKEERKSCPSTPLSHFCSRTHIPVQLNGLQLAARKTGIWKSFISNSKIPAENCVSGAKAKRRTGVSLVCPTASIWGEEEMKLSVASQGRSQGWASPSLVLMLLRVTLGCCYLSVSVLELRGGKWWAWTSKGEIVGWWWCDSDDRWTCGWEHGH